jgi:hypothetical protein
VHWDICGRFESRQAIAETHAKVDVFFGPVRRTPGIFFRISACHSASYSPHSSSSSGVFEFDGLGPEVTEGHTGGQGVAHVRNEYESRQTLNHGLYVVSADVGNVQLACRSHPPRKLFESGERIGSFS